jgi:RNA polymerase sigma factor (sigma-70 family)
VQHCLEGSEDAWSALIDKYRNLIFSIPIHQGLSRDDASDVFQQVCLILVSDLPRLREARSLVSWLIQVTSHECSRRFRKNQAHMEVEFSLSVDTATLGTAENVLVECERGQILREAVAELGDRCRQLIHMLFFTTPAIPYDQLAKGLGIAKGSVGFIRMRCLGRLRESLKERGFR